MDNSGGGTIYIYICMLIYDVVVLEPMVAASTRRRVLATRSTDLWRARLQYLSELHLSFGELDEPSSKESAEKERTRKEEQVAHEMCQVILGKHTDRELWIQGPRT